MSSIRKFWPLDFDQELEIYENPSWDMPGHRRAARPSRGRPSRRPVRKLSAA